LELSLNKLASFSLSIFMQFFEVAVVSRVK
jgi:hypothetical protein